MHWKDKVEGLGNLPQENWDKNAAWEKLESRINQQPVSKKMLSGFIVVMACLVLFVGLIWKNRKNTEAAPVSANIFKPVDAKKAVPKNLILSEAANIKLQYSFPKKSAARHTSAQKQKTILPEVPEILEEQKMELTPEIKAAPTPVLPDSAVAISGTPKKLRVVHINELGKPKTENAKIASTTQNIIDGSYKNRRFNFFSPISDDNIFKIKLSPHN